MGRIALIGFGGSLAAALVVVALLATPDEPEGSAPRGTRVAAGPADAVSPGTSAEGAELLGGPSLHGNDDETTRLEMGLTRPTVLQETAEGLLTIGHEPGGEIRSATFDLRRRSWGESRLLVQGRPEEERVVGARPLANGHFELLLLQEPFDEPRRTLLLRTSDRLSRDLPVIDLPRAVTVTERGFRFFVRRAERRSVWWVGLEGEPRHVDLPPNAGTEGFFTATGFDADTATTVEAGCPTVGCEATVTYTFLDGGGAEDEEPIAIQGRERWAAGLHHGIRWPAGPESLWPLPNREALVVFRTSGESGRGAALVHVGLHADEIQAVPLPFSDRHGDFRFQACAESLWLLGMLDPEPLGEPAVRIEAVRVRPEIGERGHLLLEESNVEWRDVAVGCVGERLALATSRGVSLTP